MAGDLRLGTGVHVHGSGLAGAHVGQLGLLEVGGDPGAQGHDGHDLGARIDVVADGDGALGHRAGFGRMDHGVAEVVLGGPDLGVRGGDLGLAGGDLGPGGVGLGGGGGDLALGRHGLALGGQTLGGVALGRGLGLVQLLLGHGGRIDALQRLVADQVARGVGGGGRRTRGLSQVLAVGGLRHADLGGVLVERRLGLSDLGLRVRLLGLGL